MERFVSAVPFILGIILILAGFGRIAYRIKGALHIQGTVTDIAKTPKKYARVKTTFEAPVVKYSVKGNEYSGVSRKFYPEGVINFKKGKPIEIRVSRRNHRHFVPEESGRTPEKLLIVCGVFMIIANAVILWRY